MIERLIFFASFLGNDFFEMKFDGILILITEKRSQ